MAKSILSDGIPTAIDAERFVLGAFLAHWVESAGALEHLTGYEFSLENHQRVFAAVRTIAADGRVPDRVTTVQYLADRYGDAHHWLGTILNLEDGMPVVLNLESYIEILREKAALRRILYVAQEATAKALSGIERATDIIQHVETTLRGSSAFAPQCSGGALVTPEQILEAAGGLQQFLLPGRKGRGIDMPEWPSLIDKTAGFRPGELFIVAANTGMGKSSGAMQVALSVAKQGHYSDVFSLEMSKESLLERMACAEARVDAHRYRTGHLGSDERMKLQIAMTRLVEMPYLRIDDGASVDVTTIRRKVQTETREDRKPELIVVDYLQLMRSLGRHTNRHGEISEIARALKLLAVEEQCCVVLLSQLNRDNIREGRPPGLGDLRESGSIEENADAVLFLWRPEMLPKNRERQDLRGHAQMILAKQRNGPTGAWDMVWLGQYTKFEEQIHGRTNRSQEA